jgi:DNA-binding MarR family transcriptional regulator
VPSKTGAEQARFTEMMRRAKRDKDASRTAVAILRADSKVSQLLERALAEAGLSLPQFNVVMELASSRDGELPLHELNSRLISTPPNTSWLSKRMEEAGLLTKVRDTQDCRVVNLKLTEQGWAALETAAPLVFKAEKRLLGAYSRDELRHLAGLLGPLIADCHTESFQRDSV